MKYPVALTCGALWLASVSSGPGGGRTRQTGTVLAEKQQLVRHIKDEPASLDPAKAVGPPEIQVIRDLFEGLVNQDAKGNLVPGWRPAGRAMITASGPLPCAITPAGPTVRRSPPRISSIAGGVWWIRKPLRRSLWFAALAGIANAQNIIDGKAAPETLGSPPSTPRLRVQLDKPLPWFSNLTASFAFYPVQKPMSTAARTGRGPAARWATAPMFWKDRVVNEKTGAGAEHPLLG